MPWYTEDWSRGILLGLDPDPNTGYRATIWFEYTRALFNQIREGSLVAVRNFNDRPRNQADQATQRTATYEEYSILQIDQVHPWHYAIQGSGDRGYPAFNVAAAESARRDWVEWDEQNRDDVTRIRCEAIPLRLAFCRLEQTNELPPTFADRSKPMPGYEVRVLRPQMTQNIVNQGLQQPLAVEIGTHLVQSEVIVQASVPELLSLHFGVFGFTGAGKSNLLSTLIRRSLASTPSDDPRSIFKVVLLDLMDEYTGLLIDELVEHRFSRLIIAGRRAVDDNLLAACRAVINHPSDSSTEQLVQTAAETWSQRIILPAELRALRETRQFIEPLAHLIRERKVRFYEPLSTQGQGFDLNLNQYLNVNALGAQGFGSRDQTQTTVQTIIGELQPLLVQAQQMQGEHRDHQLETMAQTLRQHAQAAQTDKATNTLNRLAEHILGFRGSRGELGQGVGVSANALAFGLNMRPRAGRDERYEPALTVVVGENESSIAVFAQQLINETFEQRRSDSILYPIVSFVFDEADVFISSDPNSPGNVIGEARLLARRGRKFGLGLGIATQRIIYLDSSIMAQPHTYFISKLPRESDRNRIAEAFAISPESLEQSFAFTAGQWLIASYDATGLKGTPFPVQLPNANDAIRVWLENYQSRANHR